MDIIRKHGLWIIAGVIVICAIGFYFTVVRKLAKERVAKISTLETRRSSLEGHASKPKDIPGSKWEQAAVAYAEDVAEQLERCAQYLAQQPRNCHTRRFLEDERAGMGAEIADPIVWEGVLDRNVLEVQRQLEEAKLFGWVPSVPIPWRGRVPTPAEIKEAQEVFWFVKDLADVLTGQVEKDFEDFLEVAPGFKDSVFKKPADLVIDRKLSSDRRLDELMRFVPREKLLTVLEAILINDGQVDLPSIFDTYLSSDDERMNFSWDRVLGLTMDDEQSQFLKDIVPDGNDLANRQRFVDYIMELRTVRYRSDVIGLLENHDDGDNDLKHVASSVKEVSPEGRARLIREMRDEWNETRIAQTIATVVSVYDEKDYRLLRDNHNPQIVELPSVSVTRPEVAVTDTSMSGLGGRGSMGMGGMGMGMGSARGGLGGGQGASGGLVTEYFKSTGFSMTVVIELEQLPVLLRRLLSNSWYYTIVINSIEPVSGSAAGGGTGGRGMSMGMGGARGMSLGGRTSGRSAATGGARAGAGATGADSSVALRNYVTISITGEGYQFAPLQKSLEADTAEASTSGTDASAGTPKRSSRPAVTRRRSVGPRMGPGR